VKRAVGAMKRNDSIERNMHWTAEAEAAVKKVPFFVRKRVRARVEEEARAAGKQTVTLADIKASQKRFLSSMESEIKGYQLDTCFGPGGCPNRACIADGLVEEIERLLKKEDLLRFLKQHVKEDLKFHHEFRVTLADCPNACSQPQIKDIGIIGACLPRLTREACTHCRACVAACEEGAVDAVEGDDFPVIDFERCVKCGRCISACPTGTIAAGQKGFRVQLGGKLGRHPRLARELTGIYTEKEVLEIVGACIDFYKKNSKKGARFADILTDDVFKAFAKKFGR